MGRCSCCSGRSAGIDEARDAADAANGDVGARSGGGGLDAFATARTAGGAGTGAFGAACAVATLWRTLKDAHKRVLLTTPTVAILDCPTTMSSMSSGCFKTLCTMERGRCTTPAWLREWIVAPPANLQTHRLRQPECSRTVFVGERDLPRESPANAMESVVIALRCPGLHVKTRPAAWEP